MNFSRGFPNLFYSWDNTILRQCQSLNEVVNKIIDEPSVNRYTIWGWYLKFCKWYPTEISLPLGPALFSGNPNHSIIFIFSLVSNDWKWMKGGEVVIIILSFIWFFENLECSCQKQFEFSELWNIPCFHCWIISKNTCPMGYSLRFDCNGTRIMWL